MPPAAAAAGSTLPPTRRSVPPSTYRLQIRPAFGLAAAADTCGYLTDLGAGALYLSPLLPSTLGSDHGYDVVAFDRIDPQRGGARQWQALLERAGGRLPIIVDIVPNHTGVQDAAQNPAWWDVLRLGRDADHAHWFDIEWSRAPILLPMLGAHASLDELRVEGDELRYFEHRFPLAPGTSSPPSQSDQSGQPGQSAADVHARQHYRLVDHRLADTEQNYRRFFAVSTLAGLRVEDERVFSATHAEIARWLHRDGVMGLRVDHPDGLADPRGYLHRLRELAGSDAWIVVEKILEPGERLPDWPVDGTTGYDAVTAIGGLFVDPSSREEFDRIYRSLTADEAEFADHVRAGKQLVASTILQAEVSRLARLVPDVPDAATALAELLVAFDVYRSYLPDGAHRLEAALAEAAQRRPDLADALAACAPRLADPADELCVRFQQTSGAVMAKGVEDTAYYRYSRFIALNEVGGDPASFGIAPEQFHVQQRQRLQELPASMTTLSTHDTKRSEDVRARLAVLSELPDRWADVVTGLMTAAPIPDRPFAYLLWQTFVGAGFIARERMHDYATKAMREAASSTSWTSPDEAFETAVHAAVDAAYDRPDVHGPLADLIEDVTPAGWANALAQKLIQLTVPGVPDVYQGTEVWTDALVDPDNRRPVDFGTLAAMLAALDAQQVPPPVDASGAAKLWLVSRTLRLRRDEPHRFGSYLPVHCDGPASEHAVGFDRGGAITVATRLPLRLARAGDWRDTELQMPANHAAGADGPLTDVLTGRRYRAPIRLRDLLAHYPVALLTY